ncbi:MAG: aminotransferase class I/II-fold pyridoxal phosphate-dependent enzyme [Candidatus Moduliflexus flocculans]|nr:aminotransferase class I/II-fold pyridoxal phosphate-dependent enzyme [Candidatus Moduliflexus flocculans]
MKNSPWSTTTRRSASTPISMPSETKQDIEVIMEGERKIMIGSNNYLGLTGDARVIKAGVDAMNEFGSGVSGSRFLNGTLTTHIRLEKELAEFLHEEACVTFSTGFQSNLGILSAIAGRNDLVFSDRENHASIYDGVKLSYATLVRYKHNDMQDLEKCLAEADQTKGFLIVTDGVFSMSGDICKLPEIVRLGEAVRRPRDDRRRARRSASSANTAAAPRNISDSKRTSTSSWARSPSRSPRSADTWSPSVPSSSSSSTSRVRSSSAPRSPRRTPPARSNPSTS